jgi:DNA-binding transcriptional regulator YdaS (Cro superfamily)
MTKRIRKLLDDAIAICGGKSELARACGLNSRQVIDNAYRRGSVSPELALAIDKATDGQVSKESLVWGDDKKAA